MQFTSKYTQNKKGLCNLRHIPKSTSVIGAAFKSCNFRHLQVNKSCMRFATFISYQHSNLRHFQPHQKGKLRHRKITFTLE